MLDATDTRSQVWWGAPRAAIASNNYFARDPFRLGISRECFDEHFELPVWHPEQARIGITQF